MGTHSHGQGHEITFSQIVADILGLSIADIKIRYGDTDHIEHGTGTFGSRSVAAGSVALIKAADAIIDRGKKIAAAHFEVKPDQITFEDGVFQVSGSDNRHISM
jgi:carbon-monoxide dehydrogenase large subunit